MYTQLCTPQPYKPHNSSRGCTLCTPQPYKPHNSSRGCTLCTPQPYKPHNSSRGCTLCTPQPYKPHNSSRGCTLNSVLHSHTNRTTAVGGVHSTLYSKATHRTTMFSQRQRHLKVCVERPDRRKGHQCTHTATHATRCSPEHQQLEWIVSLALPSPSLARQSPVSWHY